MLKSQSKTFIFLIVALQTIDSLIQKPLYLR
jgi:hypothetical protein